MQIPFLFFAIIRPTVRKATAMSSKIIQMVGEIVTARIFMLLASMGNAPELIERNTPFGHKS